MKLEIYTGYKIETQTFDKKVFVNPNIIITDFTGEINGFIPADHDLNEFQNLGADPFAHVSDIPTELGQLGNNGIDPYARVSELQEEWIVISENTSAEFGKNYLVDSISIIEITLPDSTIEKNTIKIAIKNGLWEIFPPLGGTINISGEEILTSIKSTLSTDSISLLSIQNNNYIITQLSGNIEIT